MAGNKATVPPPRSRILDWLDVFAKLLGASAVLLVALFANSLQGRLTSASIQSQREQAEGQLRSSMFNSLISPFLSPGDKRMSADRELVMTELLALNLNENFEMKPLMEHAARSLVEEYRGKSKDGSDPRERLWSLARGIAQRQSISISREWAASKSAERSILHWRTTADSSNVGCEINSVNFDERTELHGELVKPDTECQVSAAFRDIVDLKSPDGHYTLRMVATHANWADQEVKVSIQTFLSEQPNFKSTDTHYSFNDFHLTWLDLPLTDNTLLADGNRYAAYLRSFYGGTVSITVMWFPKGYFTPRERPLHYNEVQPLLGGKAQ